jgi:hypothetical protein
VEQRGVERGSARARTPAEELPGARLARRAAVRRTPSGVLRCAPARAKGTRAGLGELREGTVQRDRYPGHPMPKLGETSLPVRSGPAWGRRCDAPGVSGHQGHRDTGTSGRKRPCRLTRLEARIWPRPPPIRSNAPLTSAVRMSTPDAPPSRARWGAWPHGGCDQTAPSKGGIPGRGPRASGHSTKLPHQPPAQSLTRMSPISHTGAGPPWWTHEEARQGPLCREPRPRGGTRPAQPPDRAGTRPRQSCTPDATTPPCPRRTRGDALFEKVPEAASDWNGPK